MEIEQEFETIMGTVKSIMERDERARNDDKFLIISVLRAMGFKIYIDYKDLPNIPSFESITRARRKLQEIHSELAPQEHIEVARSNKEQKIRELMLGFRSQATEVTFHFLKPRQTTEVFK